MPILIKFDIEAYVKYRNDNGVDRHIRFKSLPQINHLLEAFFIYEITTDFKLFIEINICWIFLD